MDKLLKQKTKEVYQMDVLNSFNTEEIREMLISLKNARIIYGRDRVAIYLDKKGKPYILDFFEYGQDKESVYRYQFENIVMNLEISTYGESALFSVVEYSSREIMTSVKLYLE